MTRTLFFFTALVGMLVALTAVLIRIELYAPGVTALFQDANGDTDRRKFEGVVAFHEVSAYLFVMVLGTTMMSAARDKGASFGRFFMALGVLICVAVFAYSVLSVRPGPGLSYLEHLIAQLDTDAAGGVVPVKMFLFPAAALLYLGAYMMVATQTGWRLLGPAGFVMVILFVLAFFGDARQMDVTPAATLHVLLTLPLLACISIRLIDDAIAWLLMLACGLLVCLIALVPALYVISARFQTFEDTIFDAAMLYTFPLGIAWYALPALMMYTHKTRLGAGGVLGIFGAITVGLFLWIVPLFQLGVAGQPRRFVDYQSSYAPLNATATAGVAIFILIYLACIIILRRNRLPHEP